MRTGNRVCEREAADERSADVFADKLELVTSFVLHKRGVIAATAPLKATTPATEFALRGATCIATMLPCEKPTSTQRDASRWYSSSRLSMNPFTASSTRRNTDCASPRNVRPAAVSRTDFALRSSSENPISSSRSRICRLSAGCARWWR